MASVAFLILTLGLVFGLLWTLQEMIVKGKWNYFIFFLAGFLPIYITFLCLAYLNTRSVELVILFQALKEGIVGIALVVTVLFQKNPADYPFRPQSTDWWMGGFLILGFSYLVLPIGEVPFLTKALYFKGILLPGLTYFLGRNTIFEKRELSRLFSMIFIVAILAFVVNLIEQFVLQAHLQQYTGYSLYNQMINDIDPSGNFGLTWTFETQTVTKRLASFFSDPLEMASSVLMGFAAGLIWYLTTKKEEQWLYLVIMACSLGSLIFSASRAAFGAFFILLFFVALVFRLYKLIGLGFVLLLVFAGYVVWFASDDFYFFVLDTLTFENSSSVGHVLEWLVALESMVANPLGIGLAMSGNAGSVSDALRIGGENQFLIYGVQLGWIGMILYVLALGTGVVLSLRVFYTTANVYSARLAFVGSVTKVALFLPLFTANAELYTYVTWISWWMIGYTVREYSALKSPQVKEVSH
ncbi:MAG: O-antigen ligase family protein [Bacteroidetes bacterium]|nr:O-antigen ligase family protein [Bacteroidota bacterium]MDA1267654.1 O-antigen ligase family protein [Bacteroidota bacterium]